jgi:hypothetical protein
MVYVKRGLGAVAALTISLVLCIVDMARYTYSNLIWHGHGGGLDWNFAMKWRIRQPAVWAVAFLLFLLFIKSSQLHSKKLRVLLFWTPTLVGLVVTAGLASLYWALNYSR